MKKQIVDIQSRREDQALKAFIDKKNIYEEYKKEHEELKKRLAEFRVWRAEESTRVFDELKKEPVSKKELDKIKEKLAQYKFEELALAEEEMKLSTQLVTYEENKDKAYQEYQDKRIRKNKFEKVYKKTKAKAEYAKNKKEENEIDEDMILNFNFD